LQYVSQLVDVKHTGAFAIGKRHDAMDGTCLAFGSFRIGIACDFSHARSSPFTRTPT
jgi:hypothetical protein